MRRKLRQTIHGKLSTTLVNCKDTKAMNTWLLIDDTYFWWLFVYNVQDFSGFLQCNYAKYLICHWLQVNQSITSKILLITYKALSNLAPPYILDMLTSFTPSHQLCSSHIILTSIVFSLRLITWKHMVQNPSPCQNLHYGILYHLK